MAAARHVLTVPLAVSAFVGVFYAIAQLMVFLSLPIKIPIHQAWIVNLLDDWSRLETSLLPLTIDAILIVTFILVHSFLRSEIVKSLWQKLGLASASRSIYNLVTAATILVRFWDVTIICQITKKIKSISNVLALFQLLINKWERVPLALWNLDTESNQTLYWLHYTVHAIAWIIIYGGSIVMDLPELIGVKQVCFLNEFKFFPKMKKKISTHTHLSRCIMTGTICCHHSTTNHGN